MIGIERKLCSDLVSAGNGGACGRRSLPWKRCCGFFPSPCSIGSLSVARSVVRLVVVVRPAWGRRWCAVLLHVFLLGRPLRGLRPIVVHAQDPPMVVVVLR